MTKQEIISELNRLGIQYNPEEHHLRLKKTLDDYKSKQTDANNQPTQMNVETPVLTPDEVSEKSEDKMQELVSKLLAKVESLESKDAENQKQLKMLYEVADKGRIYNYENQRADKKPFKIHLSVLNGSVIVGWRTVKDEAIFHPQTGKQVGEVQEYELILLNKDNTKSSVVLNGYSRFSDARYSERIEAEVVSKKEDYQGNFTFDVRLPDGRIISLESRFAN